MNEEIRQQVEQIKREWDALHESQEQTSKAYDILISHTNELKKSLEELITIPQAMDRLRQELQKDKQPGSYFHAWQCNIAMCFYDAVRHKLPGITRVHDLHTIANEAAVRFLEILCLQNNSDSGLTKQIELQQSQQNAPQPPQS